MSSPLPVPSKVAVTAIRGLIVGTSCSLALIAEDRRRRINNAHSAVQNAHRIRSARNYRAGAGDLAVALEEEAALLEPVVVPWTPRPRSQQHTSEAWDRGDSRARQRRLEFRRDGSTAMESSIEGTMLGTDTATATTTTLTEDSDHIKDGIKDGKRYPSPLDSNRIRAATYKPPPPFRIHPPAAFPPADQSLRREKAREEATSALAFPTTEEIAAIAKDVETTPDARRLDSALLLVREALAVEKELQGPDPLLHQATAALVRACRNAGRLDDARNLLRLAISRGPLDEEEYFAMEPLELIEGLLLERESVPSDKKPAAARRDKLSLATELYLPTFRERPKVTDSRAFDTGRRLLESWFSLGELEHVDSLYWRCLVHRQDDFQFVAWFLAQLHEKAAHRKVVKYFSLCYAKMAPSKKSILAVGDMVVDSVAAAHDFKAGEVLRALRDVCSGTCMLKTTWAIRLLSSHWKRHGDLAKTEQLFKTLLGSGLGDLVPHRDGLYRIMVEMSFQADQPRTAESYMDQAIKEKPVLASDVHLLGLVGRYKARAGDWGGVRQSFEAMDMGSKRASEAAGDMFVPILKMYARSHTMSETEDFLRFYVDELKIPVAPYTVTLVAYHYGAVRDVRALVQWLKYCADSGFRVDAAFSNAILTNCRKRWQYTFCDLRAVFLKLRALSPEFADKYTERVMVQAAFSDAKYRAKSAAARLLSLDINPDKLVGGSNGGACATPRDVVQAMKRQLTLGRPGRALGMYKRAQHLGTPFTPHALHLAVRASLKLHGGDDRAALCLVRRAQREGRDVSGAAVPILAARINRIGATLAREDRAEAIRGFMGELETAEGIRISDVALNMAAVSCLRAGQFADAASFGLAASQAVGDSEPCYDMFNFSVLLSAYAGMGDLENLRRVIAKAQASSYWTESYCLDALQRCRGNARSRRKGRPPISSAFFSSSSLSSSSFSPHTEEEEVMSAAVEDAVQARRKLGLERQRIQEEMMGIMKQAAADTTRQRPSPGSSAGDAATEHAVAFDKLLRQPNLHVEAVSG